MKRAIFISYRRDDTEGEAGRLFDDLTQAFGEAAVFMDVDGITPGMDFRKAIDENVSSCGVLLAVIGKTWTTVASSDGNRRIDDRNDFVRLEIAAALQRNVAVIPVLVHGAQMPHADQLPDDLKDLAYRNGVEITHARWNSDVQLLVKALQHYIAPGSATDTHPVHAAVPVQLPPPSASAPQPSPAPKRPRQLGIGIAVAAAVIIAIAGFLYFHGRNVSGSTAQQALPTTPAAVTPVAANGNPSLKTPLHPDLYIGQWVNPAAEAKNALARLQVTMDGDHLSMHGWGNCSSAQCDWGTVPGSMNVYRLEGKFDLGADAAEGTPRRVALVSVYPQRGTLDVMITNTYASRPANHRQFTFQRAH